MSSPTVFAKDPNVLFHLITSALAGKGACVANRHQEPPVGTTNHLGYSNPSRLLATPNHVRTLSNAIVDIFSIPSHNSDLACGMRRHDATATLELILCSQGSLCEVTVQRIMETWDLMAALSSISASSSSTEAQIQRARFNVDCNTISIILPRLRRAFDEELVELQKWKEQQVRWHSAQERNNRDISMFAECPGMFNSIADKVARCCKLMEDITPWSLKLQNSPRADWAALRKELKDTQNALTGPLKGTNNFRKYELTVCGQTKWLKNVLERLDQHLKHLFTLRQYASSRKTESRVICTYSLTITRLECLRPQYSIPWPSSIQMWQDIRDTLHSDHQYTFIGDSSAHDPGILQDTPSQLLLHPELTIFTYLNDVSLNNDGSSFPYNHISIAGLACKACSLWIKAYNRRFRDIGFAINGSNNEWKPQWAMPDLELGSQALREEITDIGLKIYFHFMEKFKQSKSLEPDPVDSDDERDKMIAQTDFYYYADY